jgi:hypothetical protein
MLLLLAALAALAFIVYCLCTSAHRSHPSARARRSAYFAGRSAVCLMHQLSLQRKLDEIGRMAGASAKAVEPT